MGVQSKEGCKQNNIRETITGDGDHNPAKKDIEDFIANMELLKNICPSYAVDGTENGKSLKAARVAIPIVTTLAGGALGAGITASVIKQKKENIQNEAAQKWMEEVGDHIECYIGTDSLGTYGDAVAIEID